MSLRISPIIASGDPGAGQVIGMCRERSRELARLIEPVHRGKCFCLSPVSVALVLHANCDSRLVVASFLHAPKNGVVRAVEPGQLMAPGFLRIRLIREP